ncbi:MAG: hypothetical protein WCL07_04505 [bacterium]
MTPSIKITQPGLATGVDVGVGVGVATITFGIGVATTSGAGAELPIGVDGFGVAETGVFVAIGLRIGALVATGAVVVATIFTLGFGEATISVELFGLAIGLVPKDIRPINAIALIIDMVIKNLIIFI